MKKQSMDTNSLAHTKWNCKYHIVFAPKYRRKVIYGKIKVDIGRILRKLCQWKGVDIIEGEVCPDHIHMLVSIPPKMSVSGFMGYLKGKSSLLIFQKWGNMKFAYRNREFWCKGYYVDTAGKNTKAIKEYITNQLKVDKEKEIVMKELQGGLGHERMYIKSMVFVWSGITRRDVQNRSWHISKPHWSRQMWWNCGMCG